MTGWQPRVQAAIEHYLAVERAQRAMATRKGRPWSPEDAEQLAGKIAAQHHVSVATMAATLRHDFEDEAPV